MEYEEFKAEYTRLFKVMVSYTPNEVGSDIYAEKMATLADKYPAFVDRIEEEK
jgi:hypothetical protein